MTKASRRTILSGLALAPVSTALGSTLPAGRRHTEPDPVFALIEAERGAWDAFDAASKAYSATEMAFDASGWDRKPRVLVGEYTCIVRGPDHEQIPIEEWEASPVYAHDHDAIERDCDGQARYGGVALAKVEVRRARLHRELDEDAAAIEVRRAPTLEAERLSDEAVEAWHEASDLVAMAAPLTVAGVLAMIERFEFWTADGMFDHDRDGVTNLLAHVRRFLGGKA